jgi:hypothetical protein
MKKFIICIMIPLYLMGAVSLTKASALSNVTTEMNSSTYDTTMKQDLLCLMMAYPEYAVDVVKESSGPVYLVMKSGRKILYDDKKIKTFEQKLSNPDLQDMLEQPYPLETTLKLMDKSFDPGRFRVYSLLSEVYGASRQAVEHNLINVSLGYRNFQFNRSNNAAASLKASMNELIPLASKRHDVGGALFPSSGTFNYRLISGTDKLSPHSFGIAIDLARDSRDYWQWASKEEGQKRLNSYPKEVVTVFEKNNFVWGGKWSHFDTLHFEYRPEIILKARYFTNKNSEKELWYKGSPYEEAAVKSYIEKINKALDS